MNMGFYAISLNYKSAPLSVREKLTLSSEKQESLLESLRENGLTQAAYLTTCNRSELYGVGDFHDALDILAQEADIPRSMLLAYVFTYEDQRAIRHLLRVTAGMESMVFGEDEILRQSTEAYNASSNPVTNAPVIVPSADTVHTGVENHAGLSVRYGNSAALTSTSNTVTVKPKTPEIERAKTGLAEAQKNGFAERNPSADIEGGDACRKIAILSSIAYGRHISWDKIYTEGISGISAADFKYAQEIGAKIRLVATSVKKPEGYYAMVAPGMVNESDPLYGVNGVFNAVKVHGNMLGDAMFYGSGAGKLPTASAVAGDVVDEARHLHETITTYWSDEELPLQPVGNMENRFFVRVQGSASDRAEEIRKIFGNAETISLPSLPGEFAFITDRMKESEFADRSGKLGGMISRIRVLFA